MSVLTLLGFLVGDRRSILAVAGDRNALWIGFIFVLSAGFAREYDGEDLLAEPWHLLLPLGASLVTSFLLWISTFDKTESVRWDTYPLFLGLFWMTAPLAWLYAIPYERFLGPDAAIRANLWTLGVVATWRVVLMIRVLSVWRGLTAPAAVINVMAYSALLVVVAGFVYFVSGKSAVGVMGGLREPFPGQTADGGEILIHLAIISFLSLPVWCILHFVFWWRGDYSRPWEVPTRSRHAPTAAMLLLMAGSILVWALILPHTQAEQRLRTRFERALKAKRYDEAAALLNDHLRGAFPPHWQPPPLPKFAQAWSVPYEPIIELLERPLPGWAFDLYFRRLGWLIDSRGVRVEDPERLADLVLRLPGGAQLIKQHIAEGPWDSIEENRKALRDLMAQRQKGK